MIGVIRRMHAKPEMADQFAALLEKLQRDVLVNEPDVVTYQVMRGNEDLTLFVIAEVFRNQAARDAHPNMPYHKDVTDFAWSCVEGEPDIQVFSALTDSNLGGVEAAFS
jgi:quinol monooxygenase YgiN